MYTYVRQIKKKVSPRAGGCGLSTSDAVSLCSAVTLFSEMGGSEIWAIGRKGNPEASSQLLLCIAFFPNKFFLYLPTASGREYKTIE